MSSYSEQEEATEVLRNLSLITAPQLVTFQEMTKLMQQCELLDEVRDDAISSSMINTMSKSIHGMGSVLSLLSGILPGGILRLLFTDCASSDFKQS